MIFIVKTKNIKFIKEKMGFIFLSNFSISSKSIKRENVLYFKKCLIGLNLCMC